MESFNNKIFFIIIVHAAGFFIRLIKGNILVFSKSCGVDMGDQYVVTGGKQEVIGGWDAGTQMYTRTPKGLRKVGLYNDYGFVRNLPDLVLGRYNHACAGFQDINGDMVGVIFLYS